MKNWVVVVVAGLLLHLLGTPMAAAQTAAILPNAMTQFVDGNGVPYAGGRVYFYIPGTTTPSPTWQDPNQTTANSNPVVLDANGRAIIWGNGEYREILQDPLGNVVWDQITYNIPTASASILPSGMVSWFNLAGCPSGWVLANGTGATADARGRYIRDLDQGTGRDPSGTPLAGAYSAANGPITATVATTGTGSGSISGVTGTVVVTATTAIGAVGAATNWVTSTTSGTSPVSGTASVTTTSTGSATCTNCGAQTVPDTVVLLACQKL